MLATLGVPFDEEAVTFAVDSAVEAGQPLIVANITRLEPLGLSMILGYDALEEFTPEVSASARRPTELARSLGIRVERLRVRSPRPVEALLQLIRERVPGLLVFGPAREGLSPRRYRRAVRALRENAPCLIWLPA
jgi:universal stress protein family protein